MSRANEIKYRQARETVKQRPFSKELNLSQIVDKISEIGDACYDIQWADDQLDDILGEELADTYRLQFSDLSQACEDFFEDYYEYNNVWTLDGEREGESYFDALVAASGGTDDLVYLDEGGDGDYTPLLGYAADFARRMEAVPRIRRLTKDKLIELIGDVLGILTNYWDITLRHANLCGVYEIVKEEACEELDNVKGVEKAWAAWDEGKGYAQEQALAHAVSQLPAKVWIY